MDGFLQDLRYSLRSLWKSPGFTIVAVLALALGIGANTVLFSVISFTLLRPVPFHDPDRLVVLNETQLNFPNSSCAWLNYLDWKAQAGGLFTHFAATRRESFNLTSNGEPERVLGRMATAELLPELGVTPALGRLYGPDDDKPGAPRTVVLTWGLWQRRFGGDSSVIGRSIQLSGDSYTVIGVLPRDFRFLSNVELFVPLGLFGDRYKERDVHPGIYAFGRLAPGVSLQQAQRALDAIALRIDAEHPQLKGNGIRVRRLSEDQVEDARPALLVLWGAVGLVLLIAAANVGNLMLARAAARQQEMAVRVALGAGRGRLVRQLLTESVLLAAMGALVALATAAWSLDLLAPLLANLPRAWDVRVDGTVFGYTAALALLTGIGFGLYPALRASDPSVHTLLKESPATGSHARMRSSLIVAEVALSMMLLVGAGLMLRSFARVSRVDPGFEPSHVIAMSISLPPSRYRSGEAINAFISELRRRAAELPGVVSAAVAAGAPFLGAPETGYSFEGREPADPHRVPSANLYAATPGYLETLRIPIVRGRGFTEADRGRNVALIDERIAERAFPGEDPIGHRMAGQHGMVPPMEVVGVVRHVENYSLDGRGPVDSGYYLEQSTAAQLFPQYSGNVFLLARTMGDPLALAAPLRKAVLSIDPLQPVYNVQTLEQAVDDSVSDRRLSLVLLGVFAAVALLLAGAGIYGVMSYSVAQRTREIGIRMALGARRAAVLRLVVGSGARLAAIGILIGAGGAFALSRVMAGLLFGVSPTDPVTYAALAAVLGGVALLACWAPAMRAVSVDPAVSLRAE